MTRKSTLLLVVTLLLASGCSSPPARSDVLVGLADAVIIPAYQRLAVDAEQLEADVADLCAGPDDQTLAAARTALADARSSWSFTEAMWLGPVSERRSWAVIDWPIAVDQIEALIADETVPLEVDLLARRVGADQRGLRAVEYLLGGERGHDAVGQLADPRRCQYLMAVTTVISDEADLLTDDWASSWEDGPTYRELLSGSGSGSGSGGGGEGSEDSARGIDSLVNDALFLLEAMGDTELGWALGTMDGPAAIDRIEEGSAGLAAEDLVQHLTGLRAVMLGDPNAAEVGPTGLSSLLNEDLRERLAAQFDTALAAAEALRDRPLRASVTQSPEAVSQAREAIKAIQATVATEVVSALGVTIGFSDADGDTGA